MKKTFNEWMKSDTISEQKEKKHKKMTIIYDDYYGSLEKLIKFIQENGNNGHSFHIEADEGKRKESFFWDGDGGDYIKDIIIEK